MADALARRVRLFSPLLVRLFSPLLVWMESILPDFINFAMADLPASD